MENHVSSQQQTETALLDAAMIEGTEEGSSTLELSADEVEFAFGHAMWGS